MNAQQSFQHFFGGSFVLNGMIAVVVPSTLHSVPLAQDVYAYWIKYTEGKMSDIFGACSSVAQYGTWQGIKEDSMIVYSYFDKSDDAIFEKMGKVQSIAYTLQYALQQECIGIMYNGELSLWSDDSHKEYQAKQNAKIDKLVESANILLNK